MKDLSLSRLIPLSTVGAVVAIGCGGRSIDASGDGGSGAGPLTEQGFEERILEDLQTICEVQAECYDDFFSYEYGSSEECAEAYRDNFDYAFDFDSRECRNLALEAMGCLAESASCSSTAGLRCEDEIIELFEECSDFGFYDYYYYY